MPPRRRRKSERTGRPRFVWPKDSPKSLPTLTPEWAIALRRIAKLMRPPPIGMRPSVWAERHRVLSPEANATPGRWRNRNTPYLVDFMDAGTVEPGVTAVIGIFASQTGKTEGLLNIDGYQIDYDPGPSLNVQPTLEMAKTWSKDRFATMIRDCPRLASKVSNPKARTGANTVRHKQYPGGHHTVAGANSPADLAARPIRHLRCDELGRWPASAGTEGDPLSQANARTRTFHNATRYYVTSPGTAGRCRSEPLWKLSDQRYYYVPCSDCSHMQRLRWAQVQWDKDEEGNPDLESARYVCERCGHGWTDAERWAAIDRGKWRATKPFQGIAGFHLNGLYTKLGGRTLSTIVAEWYACKGNREELKVFTNTVLAEWWKEEAEEKLEMDDLISRREDWTAMHRVGAVVPAGAALLTVGVDVQVDRLEYTVVGWGRGEESWRVTHGRIPGNPRRDANVWRTLERDVLDRAWIHEKGMPLYIRIACIDTGYATQAVYSFCASRFKRPLPNGYPQFVLAVKGRGNEPSRPVWTAGVASTKKGIKLNLFTIGTHAAKDQVYGRLALEEPGPGFMHFDTAADRDYFRGLLAEEAVPYYRAGQLVRRYEEKNPGSPNEPLDCWCYAYAGAVAIQAQPFGLVLETEVERIEATPQRAIETGPAGRPIVTGQQQPPGAGRGRRRGTRSKGVI